MRLRLYFILFLVACASAVGAQNNYDMQNKPYLSLWKTIDSLEARSLTKSASEKVATLLAKAENEKNYAQMLKALMYKGKYNIALSENGEQTLIDDWEQRCTTLPQPARSVLQSMLAQYYTNYLERNRYALQDRTELAKMPEVIDLKTTTTGALQTRATKLYTASLTDQTSKTTPIAAFSPILTEGKGTENLRPTVYDYLAHRALEFFKNERNYLSEPEYQYELSDPTAFAKNDVFAKHWFDSNDPNARKYAALLVFQALTQHHQNNGINQYAALLDVDLARLQWAKSTYIGDDKAQLYRNALEDLAKNYEGKAGYAEIIHYIVTENIENARKYEPLAQSEQNKTHRWQYKESVALLDKAMRTDAASYGHDLCANDKTQILQKQINIEVERYNIVLRPLLCKITYRNVPKLYYRVVKYDKALKEKIAQKVYEKNKKKYSNKHFINELLELPVIQKGEWQTNDEGDYQTHSFEAKLDGLPADAYMVLVGDKAEMDADKTAISHAEFYSTNLTYFAGSDGIGKTKIWVTDRITGIAVANAKVEVLGQVYNPNTYNYDEKLLTTLTTDNNGIIKVDLPPTSFSVRISKGNDVLHNPAQHYNNEHQTDPYREKQVRFFTDRAIYRPGQTIYYKGLLTLDDQKDIPNIVTKEKVTVTFVNTNGEEVAKEEHTTNDFGTFNGSFTAPTGGLLGGMSINCAYGSHYVQVEEYKRPKFEVVFDTLKGSYTLNEKVKVKGFAKAFAGNNVDNATVKYRVTRQTQFPYYDYWMWRMPTRNSEAQEIAHGTLTTNAEGQFEIQFDAKPDLSIPKSDRLTFTYNVSVDVIDGNGEQHSKTVGTTIGYTALVIDINLNDKLDKTQAQNLGLNTKNLNGVAIPAQGKLELFPLEMPNIVYKKRLWTRPDQSFLAKADFQNAFPNIPFQEEDNQGTWAKKAAVWTYQFDTPKEKDIKLPSLKTYSTGTYLLVATAKDASGEVIETKKYITISSPKELKPSSPTLLEVRLDKKDYEPNSTAVLSIASSKKNVRAWVQISQNHTILSNQWVELNENTQVIKTPITEAYRGGLNYNVVMVSDNRIAKESGDIIVPWSNKDLTIEYATFRDKLAPGQEEEWRITVKGNKKDKVLAEVLATMYDASLDEFAANAFASIAYPTHYNYFDFNDAQNYEATSGSMYQPDNWQPHFLGSKQKVYYNHQWFDLLYANPYMYRATLMRANVTTESLNMPVGSAPPPPPAPKAMAMEADEASMSAPAVAAAAGVVALDSSKDMRVSEKQEEKKQNTPPAVRTNLKETVFFYPNLMTDKDGNVVIKFKMNEALTRWKFMVFAHTQALQSAVSTKEVVTQKDLMVMPNPPRFLRAGDAIEFVSKISNVSKNALNGTADLQLENAVTGAPITEFGALPSVNFTAAAGQSAFAKWQLRIPETFTDAVTWRVIAKSGVVTDGEESVLPTLTNRQLVTETMPLPLRSGAAKTFNFEAMRKASESNTLTHQAFALEFTPNPAWYAVQALPYIMEYPYECTEQLFSRIYANTLASSIVKKQPNIEKVFNAWRNTDALLSNLHKNQELKSALLSETPWVLDAKNEAQQKKNIGLLLDFNKMSNERAAAFKKIQERQLPNGGFNWFSGGADNWYITQYLVEGYGHLNKLGAIDLNTDPELQDMLTRAVEYCDNQMTRAYDDLVELEKQGKIKLSDEHLNSIHIQYLYARSFFKSIPLDGKHEKAVQYFEAQAQKHWTKRSEYEQGMLALFLKRKTNYLANDIAKSLKERALNNEEMGMYWKYPSGYWWYQAPIETHALMIEVFDEVANDKTAVDDLKTWLLKNKQTNAWSSTKSTAAAIYALLMGNDDWLKTTNMPDVTVGKYTIKANDSKLPDVKIVKPEAGTGYFKVNFEKNEISKDLAQISIKNNNNIVAWGAAYWQYFEQMDKIKSFVATPLTLKKELYREENTPEGKKLVLIDGKNTLKVGDKVKMRIVLATDRDMEFVHLKDGRGATMEPINVLSGYRYQGGLGYYEETRDAATNFFFDYLPKGTYVFEYPLTIQHRGEFSCGIATIQCMYAPEFTSHTEGVRVKVE